MPAPGDPAQPVQLVDARDLADWMLDLGEQRIAGAFNGTSPAGTQTMGEVLEAAVAATASDAELVWIPAKEFPGTWTIGTERAQASGLRCRPIAETVADVWAWLRDGGEAELDEWRSEHRPPPMPVDREHALLGS